MRSSSENVDFGDASVGVARNPLRDGAPPTGLCALASRWGVRPHALAEPTKPFPHFIDHRVSNGSTSVRGDGSLPPAGYASEEQVWAAAFVKILQFPRQRRFTRMGWCSPRAASMRSARGAPPRLIAAGLVLPHASPIDFRRSGSKSRCPRDAPQHPPCPGPFRSPRVTVERRPSRNSWSALGAEDSITKGERANTLLQPIGSEATSEAGSFRRRAPVAA